MNDKKPKSEVEAEESMGDGLVRVGGVPLSRIQSEMLIRQQIEGIEGADEEEEGWGDCHNYGD